LKKRSKNLFSVVARNPGQPVGLYLAEKSLFASFSSEKEGLPCLSPAPP
jgi:hypothetical protein